MKRVFTIFKTIVLVVLSASLLASCVKEKGPSVAKAVLGNVSVMEFTAMAPETQTVTVVSDGEWHITAPEWISVDPSTGKGETQVTVSVTENADAQGMLAPRTAKLIFGGEKLSSQFAISVSQEGDAYRAAEHMTLSQVAALADGVPFILDEATVVALTSAGFVTTDGTVNVYLKSDAEVQIGDKVSVKGIKGTENGVPMVSQVDECTVKEAGDYEYPTPLDITEQMASYQATTVEYVMVSGIVSSGDLVVTADEVEYSIKQVSCPTELNLSSLAGHKVTLTGYTYGVLGSKMIGLITTAVKDNGLNKIVYFEDNFEWFKAIADAASAGDGVGKQESGATAPNVYTFDETGSEAFFKLFNEIGYEDLNPSGKVMYMQKYYLKFSKGKVVGGLRLPKMEFGATPVDVVLEFDWCAQIGGSGAVDAVSLNVELTGAGNCGDTGQAKSNAIAHKQEKDQMFWQHVKLTLEGVTDATRIEIKPTQFGATSGYYRFFLDNIKVAEGEPEPLPAGTTVFKEDFEWLAEWDAYTVDDVANNSVGSAPNVFTKAEVAGALTKFQELGYGFIWGWKDQDWSDGTPDSGNKQTLYLMKNYLKFGKSDCNSGIILPALSALKVATDVELTFNWCWCMTGKSKPDIMTLTVEADGVTTELTSSQPTAEDKTKLEWQNATVTLKGVTSSSRIILRPTNTDPYISNKDRGQNRWYLDNIMIVTK